MRWLEREGCCGPWMYRPGFSLLGGNKEVVLPLCAVMGVLCPVLMSTC